MPKRWTRRQARKGKISFSSFLSHWSAEAQHAFKMAPRSLKLNAAAQTMNSEFKGHLAQFWNKALSISMLGYI